jgi:apolipoprotein D and lipocalin family protein
MTMILRLLAVAALATACTTPHPPLPTVAAVDLARYAGTWYEIARLPNRFQTQCVSDTTATYQIEGDTVSVLNRCRTASGDIDVARGRAHAVEDSGNAKLRVSFFWPFYGDYQVLALDRDYRWVLVGEPARRYAWILARDPVLDGATRGRLLEHAAALGFKRDAFMLTRHTRLSPP